ncbi:hypothetical protein [Roseovarius albus]|uniref:hypothetical protein n=1 Tax=Roseovarius albus TaxID=1247867 RepID=UPI00117A65F7|nr:hypothetical protein [Roseovarius albus]
MPEQLVFDGTTNRILPASPTRQDWIAVALIYPAMLRGQPLHIDGPVSPTLLFNLNNDIQALLQYFNPELSKVTVTAHPTSLKSAAQGTDTGTGFSAGVDSFATLATFTEPNTPPFYRLSSLSTFNVGAMGSVSASAPLYHRYSQRVRNFASQHQLNWNTLDSNLADFYFEASANFVRTSCLRNAAAALFFQDLHKCYLYSSSYPYPDTNKSHDELGYLESVLLPLLSTENITFPLAGAGLKRTEKISKVAQFRPAHKALDVCVAPARTRMSSVQINCSRCRKCTRTMLNLDILGNLSAFSDVFDIAFFHRNRSAIIKEYEIGALKGWPLDLDVIELMRRTEYEGRLTIPAQLELTAHKAKTILRRVIPLTA